MSQSNSTVGGGVMGVQVLEVWSETDAPETSYEELLRAQPNERAEDQPESTPEPAAAPAPRRREQVQRSSKHFDLRNWHGVM